MTLDQIQAELDRLAPMLSAKGVTPILLDYRIRFFDTSHISLTWYAVPPYDNFTTQTFHTFLDFAAWIDALPTPETKALRDHNTRLAKVIDLARDNAIPDEYVAPLIVVREALSYNLLEVAK